jgi:hypothetical protein
MGILARRHRPSPWTLGRVLIVGGAVALTSVWIAVDRVPPSWDQSHYLDLTEHFLRGLQANGLHGLHHEMYTDDPSRGPLFPLGMLPFFAVFGPSVQSGLLLNVALWPVLLLSVGAIAARLADWRAGLLAMVVTATTPMVVGLSHQPLVDFLLITLTTLAVLLMLVSDGLARTAPSAVLGVVIGLGWLTKVTFLALIIGPLVVTLAVACSRIVAELRDDDRRRDGLRRLGNSGLALGLGVGLAALWYVPNLAPTLDYIQSTTGGALAIGTGPGHNFDFGAVGTFTIRLVNDQLSWLVALAVLAAAALVIPRWLLGAGAIPRAALRRDLQRAVFLVSWAAIPWASVALGRNQDPRNAAAALPAVAVLLGCLVVSIRRASLRRGLTGATAVGGVAFSLLTLAPAQPWLPDRLIVSTPAGDAVLPIGSPSGGYNTRPQPTDDAGPVMDYLETLGARSLGGTPLSVAVAQEQPSINPNTLSWLADVRGDNIVVTDLPADPTDAARTDAELASVTVILYIRPPPDAGQGRVAVLNRTTMSVVVGDRLFAIFSGHRRAFQLLDGQLLWVLSR